MFKIKCLLFWEIRKYILVNLKYLGGRLYFHQLSHPYEVNSFIGAAFAPPKAEGEWGSIGMHGYSGKTAPSQEGPWVLKGSSPAACRVEILASLGCICFSGGHLAHFTQRPEALAKSRTLIPKWEGHLLICPNTPCGGTAERNPLLECEKVQENAFCRAGAEKRVQRRILL